MQTTLPIHARIAALVLAAALAAGCSRGGGGEPPAIPPADSAGVGIPTPVPAPEVEGPDSLLLAIGPSLADWVMLWREADPGFSLDSLVPGGRRPLAVVTSQPPAVVMLSGDPRHDLLALVSPDSARLLQADMNAALERDGEMLDLSRGARAALAVTDLADGRRHVLEESGPTMWFDDGAWLDAHRFFAWGTRTWPDQVPPVRGLLEVVDLADSSVTTYWTPAVATDARVRYGVAWEKWKLDGIRARLAPQ
jgi:hypothetical protein